MRIRASLVLLLAIAESALAQSTSESPASALSDSYWGDRERGWFWYQAPPADVPSAAPKAIPPAAPPKVKSVPPTPRAPELMAFEGLQKQLEETRNIAIMNPSEANVRHYMEVEARVVAQASHFADVAQRVAWATPELDQTLQGRPVNARAIEVYDEEQARTRSTTLADLARDHVLFFFFRSDCPYCHAYAPILAALEARTGLNVTPVSVDGRGLPEFPHPRRDNGITQTLQITQVPATFVAEPRTGKITPIGFGVLSESQLLERIVTVAQPGSEDLVPSATHKVVLE